MIRKKAVPFLILLLIMSGNSLFSQNKFQDSTYRAQIKALYSQELGNPNNSRYKITDSLIRIVIKLDSTQNPQRHQKIVAVSNYYYKKKGNKTAFFSLIESLAANGQLPKSNFYPWLDMLEAMTADKKYGINKIDVFLKQTAALASEQKIYTSKLISWYSSKKTFKYSFDALKSSFKISIANTNLMCINQNDTFEIKQTSGSYNPTDLIWNGKGGIVKWQNNKAVAKLKDYNINLTKAEYIAENVSFTHSDFLTRPTLGKLADKASPWAKTSNVYPEFKSNDKNVSIKGLSENIVQNGQLFIQGTNLSVIGTERNPASVNVSYKGKRILKAEAPDFSIEDLIIMDKKQRHIAGSYQAIVSKDARITVYFGDGYTITHKSCQVQLEKDSCKINRNISPGIKSPFIDNYHNIELHVPAIRWRYDDNKIQFTRGISMNDREFELRSSGFYTDDELERLRMGDRINPVFTVWDYLRLVVNKDRKGPWVMEFTGKNYIDYLQKNPTAVKARLQQLSSEGFIDYYEGDDIVIVNKKLVNYVKFRQKRKDYDNIQFNFGKSEDDKIYLDLDAQEIVLDGADNVVLSRSTRTGFVPDGTIRIGENRKMMFDGTVQAGRALVIGQGFVFDYDSLQIRSPKILGTVFSLDDKGENPVQSNVEHFSGRVLINKKGNFSGNKSAPDYPKLISESPGKVYYDRNNQQGDAYKKENFYFTTDTFTLDSLTLLSRDNIRFSGSLETGNIMPEFRETLTVQPDASLGFVHETPVEGVDLFEGKASLTGKDKTSNTISLSNRGLTADGQIEWLTATVKADEFMFHSNSMTATANNFTIEENLGSGAKYPKLNGKQVDIVWDTENEKLICKSLKDPMKMYGNRSEMVGEVVYTPKGLTGKGEFRIDEGYFKADKFDFTQSSFVTDSCYFAMTEGKAEDATKEPEIALRATNVKAYVDVDNKKTVFQSLPDKETLLTLPKTQYKITPAHFVWKHKTHNVDIDYSLSYYTNRKFTADKNLLDSVKILKEGLFDDGLFTEILDRSEYVSTNVKQDKLNFYAKKSKFNGTTNTLTVEDVKTIQVADIVVTPKEGTDVVIQKNAAMKTLHQTSITARGRHNIKKVDINILGKNDYSASSGIYYYIQKDKEGHQEINFSKIKYDQEKKASVAEGNIEEADSLMLNDYFQFMGGVFFNAREDFLTMDGHARINPFCEQNRMWFNFRTTINPDSISIPLTNNPKAPKGEPYNAAQTFADVMYAKDSIHVFTAFLNKDPFGNSGSVFSVAKKGNSVEYSKAKHSYRITTPERLKDKNELDDMMEYNTKHCLINAQGKFEFENISYVTLNSYTKYKHKLQSNEIKIKSYSTFDFFFNNKLMAFISDSLSALQSGGLSYTDELYKYGLYRELGKEKADNFLAEISADPTKKLPKELQHTIVFSKLNFEWDQESSSFKSVGNIGIASIGNKQINKTVKGYVRIKKGNSAVGDKIDIYLELKQGLWYYFEFKPNRMITASSEDAYYDTFRSLKNKDLKDPTGRTFGYGDGDSQRNMFIYEFTGKYPTD